MPAPLAPTDLTIPSPDSRTAREILSRSISALLGDLRAIPRATATSRASRHDLEQLGELLTWLLERGAGRAGGLFHALRKVNVSALVRCLRNGVRSGASDEANDLLLRECIATLIVELAAVHALANEITLLAPPPRIVSLGLRTVFDIDPLAGALRVSPDATVHGAVRTRREGETFHPIRGEIVLACADNNPLAMNEAHPDKSGNAIDLGGRPPAAWCAAIGTSLDAIAEFLPELRAEIDLYVQQCVPVGFDPEKHLSASYQEAIGTIYLTLHPNEMTMTEAIIHEFSHNKINALFELDEVLVNAYSPLYASPVRPDPRPLHGVLLAVHAFLPVARLYEAMREAGHPIAERADFNDRFRRICAMNHEAATTVLQYGEPTPAGRTLLDEIARWNAHFTPQGA